MDITTWQVDNSHTGVNPTEQKLTPQFVSGSNNITCLYTEQLDGQVNAQPLYLTKTTLSTLPGTFSDGAQHNVVYVATQNGTVYAIDADRPFDGCGKVNTDYLWKMPLVNYSGGPTPNGGPETYDDIRGAADISPLLGLTETPVIDTRTGTLYVVVAVKDTQDLPANAPFEQVLYALDVKTGAVKGYTIINPEFNGDYQAQNCADGTTCDTVTPSGPGKIPFVPEHEHLRAGITLDTAHNTIYLAYAAHNDQTPYWGLILAYNVSDPAQMTLQGEFNSHPVGTDEEAGIWMGGASPALDPQTNQLFFATGNGSWNQNPSGTDSSSQPFTTGTNLAMSVLSLSTDPSTIVNYRNQPEMRVPFTADASGNFHWFTPNQWNEFNNGDRDLGSGGLLLLPPLTDGNGETRNLMLLGGKAGVMYLLDRTNLGGINNPNLLNPADDSPNPNAVQQIVEPNSGIFNTPTYFAGNIYYGASQAIHKRQVGFVSETQTFISSSEQKSLQHSPNKTSGNFISASSPTAGGVVWQVDGGLNAWDAMDVTNTIYSSTANLPVQGGQCKTSTWALPIVDNGNIYFSCFQAPSGTGNDPSDNEPGYLFVYGATPKPTGAPANTPTLNSVTANSSNQITVTWSYSGSDNTSFAVLRSTGNANNFSALNINPPLPSNATSFVDTTAVPDTTYFYEVQATNGDGHSSSSGFLSATTPGQYEQEGLVAYWPLDEGVVNPSASTSADATGHGHTAIEPAGAEDQAASNGVVNGSWAFHGTHTLDVLQIADAPDLDFTKSQSFTLSAWVNCLTTAGDHEPGTEHPGESSIIVKSADQGSLYGLFINSSGLWAARGPAGDLVSDKPAGENTWTHIALVQDGVKGLRYLYINGILQTNTAPAQDANGMGQLWFGEQNAVTATGAPDPEGVIGFDGNIDEVRLYNRALSVDDIQDLIGDPVLAANSLQPSGPQGSQTLLGVPLFPSPVPLTEPRVPAVNKNYTIQVQFAAPLSAIPTVKLQAQPGFTNMTGQIGTPTLDSSQTILTVPLTDVDNDQALDLNISNITSGAVVSGGEQDIPFNVLIGDVSQDHKVDSFDHAAVSNQVNNAVNAATAVFDLNGDGVIDANDVTVVDTHQGALTTPGDTNLAFFKNAVASSQENGGSGPANAFDNNLNDNWESKHANEVANNPGNTGTSIDPSFLYVDLGAPATVDGFAIQWAGSAAQVYTIDACTVQPDGNGNCSSGWQNMVTENNGVNNALKSYTNLTPVTAEFFRMNGTVRVNAQFGYQINEFYVFGTFTPGVVQPTQPPAPTITSALTATATAGQPFTYTITSNPTVTTYGATGLPAGLTFNGTTISGTPTMAGTYGISLSATDSFGQTGKATLTLTVNNPAPPVITSALTATATAGQPFPAYTITSNPQAATYGAVGLPAGLSLNGAVISGTPTASGVFNITLSATDAFGQTGKATLTLTVNNPTPPVITSVLTATVTIGQPFTYTITSNPTAATYGATGLPAGLSLNGAVISGTPTASGVFSVALSATNSIGQTGTATLRLTVHFPTPVITSALTAVATVGQPFSYTIVSNPKATDYHATGLPAGLSLNGAVISGTPTTSGSFSVTLSATNNSGQTGTATLSLTVNSTALVITSPLTATATVGQAFSYTISSNPTAATYGATGLPAGLSLNGAVISGTPTASGSFSITLSATNSTGQTDTATLTLTVNPGVVAPAAPINLTATAVSSNQINLSWTASSTPGVTYSVFRSTASGFTPSAATQVTSGLTGNTDPDAGLAAATTYFYVVEAVLNGAGATPSLQVSATTLSAAAPTEVIAIDAGNAAPTTIDAPFVSETPFVQGGGNFDPGQTITIPAAIASVAAPADVYASAHQGGSTYTIPITTPSPSGFYTVVLHFAELFFNAPAQRMFNVAINGAPVPELQNFDIVANAGNANFTAVVKTVTNVTAVNNQITIAFSNGAADQPMVNGIEIQAQDSQIAAVAPPAPTNLTPTAVSSSQINLSWTENSTSGAMYTVFRSTTSGFTPSAATQIATNLAATSFSDIGLTPATTYYYVVEAFNGAGATPSAQVSTATLAASVDQIAIDAGSATNVFDAAINTNFVGETPYVQGGNDFAPGQPITIPAAIANVAAPAAVYASAHQGNSTYTIPITTPSPSGFYTVVLHFAELFFNAPEMRMFNVAINGVPVPQLQNFDIFAAAGNANFTAVVETIPNVTAVNNQITITFSSGAADQPMVNGIEIR